jgi:acetyltransferase-like isoleucine patch superfamily enzyme
MICQGTLISGGSIRLDKGVWIKSWSNINVSEILHIGAESRVHEHCRINGRSITIGRRLWMLPRAMIGGGSAFDAHSMLRAGDFLHIGEYCVINTAREVHLGNEVGLGTRTALYTHGAYPSMLRGAPVAFYGIRIGDRSWLPGATVNPGVTIGEDCVIGVGSVVNKSIPPGSLAAGVPCVVLRENAYPRELSVKERRSAMTEFLTALYQILYHERGDVTWDRQLMELRVGNTLIAFSEMPTIGRLAGLRKKTRCLILMSYQRLPDSTSEIDTFIDLRQLRIRGAATPAAERLLDQLRRYGIRFRYSRSDSGMYEPWDKEEN